MSLDSSRKITPIPKKILQIDFIQSFMRERFSSSARIVARNQTRPVFLDFVEIVGWHRYGARVNVMGVRILILVSVCSQ